MGGILLREQELDLLEAFAEARLRFIGRDAEAPELVRQERAREADIEPPAGNAVEHGDLARELERMVEHRQHRPGDEAHRLRALRHGGEKDDRVRAVAAIAGEVVLDGAGMREAQCFGFFRDRQRFRVIVGGALVGVVDGGKNCTPNCMWRRAPVPLAWNFRRAIVWPAMMGIADYRAACLPVNRTRARLRGAIDSMGT